MKKKSPPRLSFEQRETLILEAATSLFSENGFKGTTTKAIAQRARVNEALLFRHFPKKEDLYTAIVKTKLEIWTKDVIPDLEKTTSLSLEESLIKIAGILIKEKRKDPSLLRMMLYSALEGHELSRYFFRQKLPVVEFLENFLKKKAQKGELRSLDVSLMVRAYLALVHQYSLTAELFDAKAYFERSEKEVISQFVKVFIQGIQA